MNLQSFLTGSKEIWFSLLQLSFAWMNQDPILVRKGYVELFRILNQIGIFGHSHFMVQFSRVFSQKHWKIDLPTVMHGKGPIYLNAWSILKQQLLLKQLCILVIWCKKEGKYMIKKSILFFLAKFLFGYASGVF